ncbi:uncharacterized protein LOC135126770 isoform X3 [Zophobas morio]|uniref:uncharacterized protein LOC135126770 isoform X3 n=1 Tax=Zophobas morio TaxID=2755281 RepID=UPI003083C939
MSSNNLIIRSVGQCKAPLREIKTLEEPPSKCQKIIHGYALPQIAIKSEDKTWNKAFNEVLLVNGCWDTSNKIPNIVAEMHNIQTEEIKALQNTCSFNDSRDFLNPSPRGSDSGIESDCTDGNLSWLLNYKIHELPPVPDASTEALNYHSAITGSPEVIIRSTSSSEILSSELSRLVANKTASLRDGINGKAQSYRYAGPKKPPFTYTELIEHALSEKGELTVSGIYQWISEHFPFYKQNDDRWKNSVRHNLSINPHFRKGSKAVHGAGHLWTIAQKDDKKTWQIKKQRMQQFIQATYKENKSPEEEALDMELQAATASILGETFNEFEQNDDGSEKKQNIEVEFINVVDIQDGLEDFLSPPVSKQQIVQECGLGSDFLITDLNPNALGLNLTEGEVINDGSFYDDMSFEYYELEKE